MAGAMRGIDAHRHAALVRSASSCSCGVDQDPFLLRCFAGVVPLVETAPAASLVNVRFAGVPALPDLLTEHDWLQAAAWRQVEEVLEDEARLSATV